MYNLHHGPFTLKIDITNPCQNLNEFILKNGIWVHWKQYNDYYILIFHNVVVIELLYMPTTVF